MHSQDCRGLRARSGIRLCLTHAPGRIVRNLQVLCESTQQLDESHKQRHSEINWRSIAGMRNILVHDYFEVDFKTVWQIVERDLPPLQTAMRAILTLLDQAT
jgi:uncharacterized protein with HEPN domain